MKKLLLALIFIFGSVTWASAQNVTCPTRPPGDSSNACASTAYVDRAAPPTTGNPNSVLTTDGSSIAGWRTFLPNGVTATTQAANDNSTKIATTAAIFNALPVYTAILTNPTSAAQNCIDIQAALTAAQSTGGTVQLSTKDNSTVTLTGAAGVGCELTYSASNNIRVSGVGPGATTLIFAGSSGGGFTVTLGSAFNRAMFDNFTYQTDVTDASATAISVTVPASSNNLENNFIAQNVNISSVGQNFYIGNGIYCDRCAAPIAQNVHIEGVINATPPSTGWVNQMAHGLWFQNLGPGYEGGANAPNLYNVTVFNSIVGVEFDGDVEGGVIVGGNFVGVNTGISAIGPVPNAGQTPALNASFNNLACYVTCFNLQAWAQAEIDNNVIYKRPDSTAAWLALGIGTFGGEGSANIDFSSNVILGFNGSTTGGSTAVSLDTTANYVSIRSNKLDGVDTLVNFNGGTNTHFIEGNSDEGGLVQWQLNPDPNAIWLNTLQPGQGAGNSGPDVGWISITGATPTVCGYPFNHYLIHQTGATNVTGFDCGSVGQTVVVSPTDDNSTFVNGTDFILFNGANYTAANGDVLIFSAELDNGSPKNILWREIACLCSQTTAAVPWANVTGLGSGVESAGANALNGSGGLVGYNWGPAPHVASNTALKAVATTTYPSGVWRDTFSSGSGAAPLFYLPSGSACSLNAGAGDNGSQVQSSDSKCWLAQFPAGPVDPQEWGALTAASDNSTAYNAAMAYRADVWVAAGTWDFTSTLHYTYGSCGPAFRLTGAGMDNAALVWTASVDGMHFSQNCLSNPIQIDGVSFQTTQAGGGEALILNNANSTTNGSPAQSNITNSSFRGTSCDSGSTYWAYNTAVHTWGNINWRGDYFCGGNTNFTYGISIDGTPAGSTIAGNLTSATTSSTTLNYSGGPPAGLVTGMYAYDITHPTSPTGFSNVEVTAVGATTVTLKSSVSASNGDNIRFVNIAAVYNISDTEFWDESVAVNAGDGVQGAVLGHGFNCLQIASTSSSCFTIPSGVVGLFGFTLDGIQAEASGFNVIIDSNAYDVAIANSIFYCTSTSFQCIYGGPSNTFVATGNDIKYEGGSTGAGGIYFNGTTCSITGNYIQGFANGIGLDSSTTKCSVQGNNLNGNTTAASDTGTGDVLINNLGYNPVGASAAANVCSSPCTVTAGASPETHYLNQSATNTATVTINGHTVATLANSATQYPIDLSPHQSMVVTWSTTAPTDTVSIH